jgi:hypothetical protein
VVLGGVSLFGGSGSAIGAIFGALMFRTIGDLLFVFDLEPLWQPLFQAGADGGCLPGRCGCSHSQSLKYWLTRALSVATPSAAHQPAVAWGVRPSCWLCRR